MDSLISASARALAAGDPLGALKCVALRSDPPALALRGTALAQLGDYPRARDLLRQAARAFGTHEALARARCVVAEAEVALALRDFGGPPGVLLEAAHTLQARGDVANAWQARLIAARRWLMLGRLQDARAALAAIGDVPAQRLPPALLAMAALATAELALRSLQPDAAQTALAQAQQAANRAGIPALQAEVAHTQAVLQQPAARRVLPGEGSEALRIADVAALRASGALLLDGCRHGIGTATAWQPLARRPILFVLARALAEAWPGDAAREALIATAFRLREPDDTHRARLRVEVGRLRALLRRLARIEATPGGFALRPLGGRPVVVIAPPIDGDEGALLALLSDGAAWSTSALAQATGASQRTVQRALAELQAQGRVRSIGRARAQRWLAPPLAGFTTILLLPTALPIA